MLENSNRYTIDTDRIGGSKSDWMEVKGERLPEAIIEKVKGVKVRVYCIESN